MSPATDGTELVRLAQLGASAMGGLDAARAENTALKAQIVDLEDEIMALRGGTGTVFSVDISSLGADGQIADATKVASHKALYGVAGLQHVRVFIGDGTLSWSLARFQALTDKDSVLISITKRQPAALKTFLANTPAKFRQRKGQVKLCYKHECEAEWSKAADGDAWLQDYWAANREIAAVLDASPWDAQSSDDVVKILLWYSQHIGRPSGGLRETKDSMAKFHGGQNFGMIGMDCYHYQVWLTNGRYATNDELFGKLITFCKSVGRPIAVPEWGGELATGDTTGIKRAQAIASGGQYLKAAGVKFANWWCATGSKDAVTGLPRDHHLDKYPSNVTAMKALMQG